MFFQSWESLLRILIVGALAYGMLVLILRISGKRTLSKMNAFDLIVTIALGSTLASVITSQNLALLDGVLAMALLIGLQLVVAWGAVRSRSFRRVIKAEPALLFYRGDFLESFLRHERITRGEVIAAVRQQGIAALSEVDSVVLETDGSLSAIRRTGGESTTLKDVRMHIKDSSIIR